MEEGCGDGCGSTAAEGGHIASDQSCAWRKRGVSSALRLWHSHLATAVMQLEGKGGVSKHCDTFTFELTEIGTKSQSES